MTGSPAGTILRDMRQLPVADLDAIAPGTSLILAPHPDDETLGCGGFVIECCARGRPPLIMAVTDGAASHPGSRAYPAERLRAVRAAELRSAAAILGVPDERVRCLGLPDSQAPCCGPAFAGTVQTVVMTIREHGVATLLASWICDPHCDHQATARIAMAAARIADVPLLFYPVWGWLLPPEQILPIAAVRGVRLDVAATRARKRQALLAHASQYSGLIADAPGGFRLPADLLAATDRDHEVFLTA